MQRLERIRGALLRVLRALFLVFRYDGHSNFHVIIFDMTASEIEYPFSAPRGDETDANHMENSQVPDTQEIGEDVYGKITTTELKLPVPNINKGCQAPRK
ncbi:hypothetical protein RHMOL_Rhmol08G0078100 [Rhododendron molle]|uniref:Uncharacterized protein n=1 Tax=Rhododendron molle TaxID=49168 RepID=A0ACC0MM46_RHOML|nr:hypothetical protein RHMOL_Rhmol08G0078100 [Rhododendron molle]